MWCSGAAEAAQGTAREAAARPDTRAGDDDRLRTQTLLGRAAGTGHLGLDDLDARLASVWAATTVGELARIEDDLPAAVRAERDREEAALRRREVARSGLRGQVTTYVAVMVLLFSLWLADGLSGGDWYPWPLWPAFFWGLAVAGRVRVARAPVP